jgi:phospholipase/lecithinase/hemolysin
VALRDNFSLMRGKILSIAAAIALLPASTVWASSFSQMYVFGDSLSDNGNAFLLSGGQFPGANYGVYHFAGTNVTTSFYSDGLNTSPVASGPQGLWVDQLAPRIGVADPLPAVAGGTNYAVASAQTGTANPQDVGNQLALFASTHPGGAPSGALYAFWAGANDVFNGGSATAAADNIFNDILGLSSAGAKNFLWLDLPLLGDTPRGAADKAALNAASLAFNTEWAIDIKKLQGGGVNVVGVDIGTLFAKIAGDPGAYGLSNVTDPAQTSGAATDKGYLFWDIQHPTTTGHALVADAAYNALNATAAPEPASVGAMVLGLVCVAGAVRKVKSSR